MTAAVKSDWRTEPLPETRATISLDRTFSPAEMTRIKAGLIPEEMEDKWFIYFDSDLLHFHRSWTGFCTYIVKFAPDGSGGRVTEALVNRDPEQYTETSDDRDREMISYLIDTLLLRRPADFPSSDPSSEQSAIEQWSLIGRAMLEGHPGGDSA